jgi:hypothetical protein
MDRKTTFIVALAYLLLLLAVGLVYIVNKSVHDFIPAFLGSVHIGVPWFGAVGAVLISLSGVFDHEHDWDADYWPWHVTRPFIGMALGIVSVLVFQAGILAVGTTPAANNGTSRNLLYFLIAFLVGYREETFRQLIKRLGDVILSPGTPGGAIPNIQDVNPKNAQHTVSTQVVITGSGLTNSQSVKFGAAPAQFTVTSDSQVTTTTPTFTAAGTVPLTVTTRNGSATTQFTFT